MSRPGVSQDPIGLRGGLNVHAYVTDPTTWTDPLGLATCGTPARTWNELNDPGWTPAVNDAWVQGAIDAGKPLELVSPVNRSTLFNPPGSRFPDTIFRRELHQLRDAGYTIRNGWAQPP